MPNPTIHVPKDGTASVRPAMTNDIPALLELSNPIAEGYIYAPTDKDYTKWLSGQKYPIDEVTRFLGGLTAAEKELPAVKALQQQVAQYDALNRLLSVVPENETNEAYAQRMAQVNAAVEDLCGENGFHKSLLAFNLATGGKYAEKNGFKVMLDMNARIDLAADKMEQLAVQEFNERFRRQADAMEQLSFDVNAYKHDVQQFGAEVAHEIDFPVDQLEAKMAEMRQTQRETAARIQALEQEHGELQFDGRPLQESIQEYRVRVENRRLDWKRERDKLDVKQKAVTELGTLIQKDPEKYIGRMDEFQKLEKERYNQESVVTHWQKEYWREKDKLTEAEATDKEYADAIEPLKKQQTELQQKLEKYEALNTKIGQQNFSLRRQQLLTRMGNYRSQYPTVRAMPLNGRTERLTNRLQNYLDHSHDHAEGHKDSTAYQTLMTALQNARSGEPNQMNANLLALQAASEAYLHAKGSRTWFGGTLRATRMAFARDIQNWCKTTLENEPAKPVLPQPLDQIRDVELRATYDDGRGLRTVENVRVKVTSENQRRAELQAQDAQNTAHNNKHLGDNQPKAKGGLGM